MTPLQDLTPLLLYYYYYQISVTFSLESLVKPTPLTYELIHVIIAVQKVCLKLSRNKSSFCSLSHVLQINSYIFTMTGKIKTLKNGFGFIVPEEGGDDIFFHSSSLQDVEYDDLKEDDAVTFETEDSDKGPRAINVARA